MREYLFRGKRKDNGEWVEGFFVKVAEHCYILKGLLSLCNDRVDFLKYGVDPETVGQYTGLRDKNGKRVFEGDIVEAVTVDTNEVRRTTIGIGLCKETVGDEEIMAVYCDYFDEPYAFPASMSEHFEVIGNIHDDPELLKEGAE